jgi:pseudouridine kinase
MKETCVFCESDSIDTLEVRNRTYYACRSCGGIFLDRTQMLEPAAEKARYEKHENGLENKGYRAYLEDFMRTVLEFSVGTPTGSGFTVFDYGSGPEPAFVELLRENGYDARGFDPYFAPDTPVFPGGAALVTALEVVEHFADPPGDFTLMAACVRPDGLLAVRTQLLPAVPDIGAFFGGWWYREDPTHVSFYSEKALQLVAERAGLVPAGVAGKGVLFFRKPLR